MSCLTASELECRPFPFLPGTELPAVDPASRPRPGSWIHSPLTRPHLECVSFRSALSHSPPCTLLPTCIGWVGGLEGPDRYGCVDSTPGDWLVTVDEERLREERRCAQTRRGQPGGARAASRGLLCWELCGPWRRLPQPRELSFLCEQHNSVTWDLTPVRLHRPGAGLPDGRARLFGIWRCGDWPHQLRRGGELIIEQILHLATPRAAVSTSVDERQLH